MVHFLQNNGKGKSFCISIQTEVLSCNTRKTYNCMCIFNLFGLIDTSVIDLRCLLSVSQDGLLLIFLTKTVKINNELTHKHKLIRALFPFMFEGTFSSRYCSSN